MERRQTFEEGVGPGDVMVAGVVESVVGFSNGGFDLGAFEGYEVGVELEAAVVVVAHVDPVDWLCGRRRGLRFDWFVVGCLGGVESVAAERGS